MTDKIGTGNASGATASVGIIGAVTLPGEAVPHPGAGSKRTADWIVRFFKSQGLVIRVDQVTMVELARPNPSDSDGLRPMLREALDGEGRPLPDRRISIIEHSGVSHPWELLLIEGENGRVGSYGYLATADAAAGVGHAWQEGRMRIDLGTLPKGSDPTRTRGG